MNVNIVLRNIFREVFDDDELVISDSTIGFGSRRCFEYKVLT